MAQAVGRVRIVFAGKQLPTLYGTGRLNPGGVRRTAQECDDGIVRYTERMTNSVIQCEISATLDLDVAGILNNNAATLSYFGDNGLNYVVKDAIAQEVGDLESGKIPVTFFGQPAEKM